MQTAPSDTPVIGKAHIGMKLEGGYPREDARGMHPIKEFIRGFRRYPKPLDHTSENMALRFAEPQFFS